MTTELKQATGFSLAPTTLKEAQDYAELIANSDMVPPEYKGKAGNVLVAVQMGMEIGLKPMQALQNIAVINGRPSIWGDALVAVVRNSSKCEYVKETFDGNRMTATCRVKRKGQDEEVRTFSQDDAQTAGLWGKKGPWTQYPKRMLQMRARAFALRDAFGDLLKGLAVAEEAQDIVDITPAEPEYYPDEDFKKNFPAWQLAIESGKRSAEDLIKMINTKAQLTLDQITKIKQAEMENAPTDAEVVTDENN